MKLRTKLVAGYVGFVLSLGVLAFFKYAGFFVESASQLLTMLVYTRGPYHVIATPVVELGVFAMLTALALGRWPSVRRTDDALVATIVAALVASCAPQIGPMLFYRPYTGNYTFGLALNLLWLWLYQRGDARSWGLALAVGALALGLHNPMPHALFVAPFLLRLVRERRWRRAAAAVVVYCAAGAMWLAWLRMANPFARSGGPGLFSQFALPNAIAFWLQSVNLSLLFTWHAPLFGALAAIGVWQARKLGPLMTDIALGVAFTLGFYLFFPLTQGHGWGYRYAYQVLGSLALLAAAGTPSLVEAAGGRRAQALLVASFATALLVQVPLRFFQGERFVRPYAAAYRHLTSQPARVVLVYGDSIWYGRDLIRNDPYLKGQPVVLAARMLTRDGRAKIEAAYPGQVVEVKDGELLRLGLTPWIRGAR